MVMVAQMRDQLADDRDVKKRAGQQEGAANGDLQQDGDGLAPV